MSTTKDEVEMIISVNGESTKIPPGFRFHPTEEELLLYYLKKKIASQNIDLDVIRDIDLNKLEPWDIQEKCKIGSGPQNEWYLFSHKDKKYPTGTRTNRATSSGFWKATGRDKVIHMSRKRIGMRKTLVFYKGRAPHGLKSDWIMHEYRLTLDHHHHSIRIQDNNDLTGDSGPEEGWVVCRVFKKKNMHNQQTAIIKTTNSQCYSFSNLPRLDNVSAMTSPFECDQTARTDSLFNEIEPSKIEQGKVSDTNTVNENNELKDWIALDRLIAFQLNGQDNDTPAHFSCYDTDLQENVSFSQINNDIQVLNQHSNKSNFQEESQVYNNNIWSCFTRSPPSSSLIDPLDDLSI